MYVCMQKYHLATLHPSLNPNLIKSEPSLSLVTHSSKKALELGTAVILSTEDCVSRTKYVRTDREAGAALFELRPVRHSTRCRALRHLIQTMEIDFYKKQKFFFSCPVRVARWYIYFLTKIPIWDFLGACNGRGWYILWPFGLLYGHLLQFTFVG
jgi:hypothetical protein